MVRCRNACSPSNDLLLTQAEVIEAVRGERDYQTAYYEARIWAAARLNQVPYILSPSIGVLNSS